MREISRGWAGRPREGIFWEAGVCPWKRGCVSERSEKEAAQQVGSQKISTPTHRQRRQRSLARPPERPPLAGVQQGGFNATLARQLPTPTPTTAQAQRRAQGSEAEERLRHRGPGQEADARRGRARRGRQRRRRRARGQRRLRRRLRHPRLLLLLLRRPPVRLLSPLAMMLGTKGGARRRLVVGQGGRAVGVEGGLRLAPPGAVPLVVVPVRRGREEGTAGVLEVRLARVVVVVVVVVVRRGRGRRRHAAAAQKCGRRRRQQPVPVSPCLLLSLSPCSARRHRQRTRPVSARPAVDPGQGGAAGRGEGREGGRGRRRRRDGRRVRGERSRIMGLGSIKGWGGRGGGGRRGGRRRDFHRAWERGWCWRGPGQLERPDAPPQPPCRAKGVAAWGRGRHAGGWREVDLVEREREKWRERMRKSASRAREARSGHCAPRAHLFFFSPFRHRPSLLSASTLHVTCIQDPQNAAGPGGQERARAAGGGGEDAERGEGEEGGGSLGPPRAAAAAVAAGGRPAGAGGGLRGG